MALTTERCPVPDVQADTSVVSVVGSTATTTSPSPRPLVPTAGIAVGGIDPCLLVTEPEAAAALRSDPGPARRPDSRTCVYGLGVPDPVTPSLVVSYVRPGGKAAFEFYRSGPRQPANLESIGGIGDTALEVWDGTDSKGGAKLIFLTGDTMASMVIWVTGGTARSRRSRPPRRRCRKSELFPPRGGARGRTPLLRALFAQEKHAVRGRNFDDPGVADHRRKMLS